jgi:hypothetical protein
MFDTKFKVKKVDVIDANGVIRKKFIPIRKTTFFGFGFWKECSEWAEIEKRIAEEKFLGMDSDSTLTHIRALIDENDPSPRNEYYNE